MINLLDIWFKFSKIKGRTNADVSIPNAGFFQKSSRDVNYVNCLGNKYDFSGFDQQVNILLKLLIY